MTHRASPGFWECYRQLSPNAQSTADRAFALLKVNPRHPSLHFKKVDAYWSVRVGLHHRALAVPILEGLLWFWIGSHAEYDNIIG